MKLRDYKKEDASIICKWLGTEEDFYKWSADKYNKYPLSGEDIHVNYSRQMKGGRFIPLMMVDDEENVVGHFIIRYPREDDDNTVRFGFIIVDPELRRKGYGTEMIRLGIQYVKENMDAARINLGVFENNEKARRCYEAIGFREYVRLQCRMPIGTWTCIEMELFI